MITKQSLAERGGEHAPWIELGFRPHEFDITAELRRRGHSNPASAL
jgi:hypothetical protein